MKFNDAAMKDALVERPVVRRKISVFLDRRQPTELTFTFRVPTHTAPALKSALAEIRNEIGARLEQPHAYATEDALTRALAALGKIAAAVDAQVENYDTAYKARVGSIE